MVSAVETPLCGLASNRYIRLSHASPESRFPALSLERRNLCRSTPWLKLLASRAKHPDSIAWRSDASASRRSSIRRAIGGHVQPLRDSISSDFEPVDESGLDDGLGRRCHIARFFRYFNRRLSNAGIVPSRISTTAWLIRGSSIAPEKKSKSCLPFFLSIDT